MGFEGIQDEKVVEMKCYLALKSLIPYWFFLFNIFFQK